jgi:hypothetical protein
MFIFNPVIAETNSDSFLSEDMTVAFYKLMEYQQNSHLYSCLPNHKVGQSLMDFDIESGFEPSSILLTENSGLTVCSIGVPILWDDETKSKCKMMLKGMIDVQPDMVWIKENSANPLFAELGEIIKEIYEDTASHPWPFVKDMIRNNIKKDVK